MIISASRRTDLPAFHARWFMECLRAGGCVVPNPRNPRQATRISLLPRDVDVFCFWTRNPRPLFPWLAELDARGYRYYFQYTILDSPRAFERRAPTMKAGIRALLELSDRIGPDRIVWRYDPIVFTPQTGAEFHREAYGRIAGALRGRTRRSVVSILDRYGKVVRRWRELSDRGFPLVEPGPGELGALMRSLAGIASANGMEIFSCAEEIDLRPFGVLPGKCIDDGYIARVFGIEVSHRKDPAQRKACGCVVSRDIGSYDTCPFRCTYCYAGSFRGNP